MGLRSEPGAENLPHTSPQERRKHPVEAKMNLKVEDKQTQAVFNPEVQ